MTFDWATSTLFNPDFSRSSFNHKWNGLIISERNENGYDYEKIKFL